MTMSKEDLHALKSILESIESCNDCSECNVPIENGLYIVLRAIERDVE